MRATDLDGRLAEVGYLVLGCFPECGVVYGVDVHTAGVGEIEEHILSLVRCPAALLEAEDEVDPLVQVSRHVLALQRLPVDSHELLRCGSPGRQHDVAQLGVVLLGAQVQLVDVPEEVGLVEELRDELLDVGHVVVAELPRGGNGVEQPIGQVEPASLKLNGECGERLTTYQIMKCNASRRVVRAVQKGRDALILE